MPSIAVLPGDGIGKEVINEGLKILNFMEEKYSLNFKFEEFDVGAERYLKYGELIPDSLLKRLETFDAIYLGAVGDPRVPAGVLEHGILLKLRFYFDQYVNLRPIKLLNDRFSPLKKKGINEINFTVIRENTEGLYAGIGGILKKDTQDEVAIQEMISTRKGVERIIRYAFEYAKNLNGKLTLCDKSNVLTYSHGLWLRVFEELKKEYPDVQTDHYYVDAITMKMVRNPEIFDVIVTCNMFGDIITDLGAELQGGMGLAASGNINPNSVSMFEPVHGSAPDIAGKGIANPIAAILAAAMMLEYFGRKDLAEKVEGAIKTSIDENLLSQDMGGNLSTSEVGDEIVKILKRG
ncbi:3-isopropylmalate dehydrogenase [Petrotoga sp. 9T1HF07.CasAA.8.2]|jgi:3-isopropylmalate dehydrogenase|uniref:3-isopropylmalate dehydrogenase n=1 Tax=Petrotoga sp. 9T1HF07.CasAA.8.2 TaxID=1434329 RepID=UPI000CC3C80A|nr:3-isopropylmalate dehydrogenase [Petrotoga sp. 9T1HF07.CasAA.8.2]PNR89027.1 3-isopropylmalate dehydrogenase [Petrotoga sp. 9T1HF07.CasAA.8.2]